MTVPSARIHLCGELRIEIASEPRRLRGRQSRIVLGLLLLERGGPVRRDALLEALRTDAGGPPPGESVLSPVLSRIRRAIGPEATIEGRDGLRLVLPEPAWVDVEEAGRAVERARAAAAAPVPDVPGAVAAAEEALALTEAELLMDLDGDWLTRPRDAIAALRVDALELIAATVVSGDPARAVRAARGAVALAPFRESARVLLIEALRAEGNLAEALRAYEDVRRLLREELGTVPGPALLALHGELLAAGGEEGGAGAGEARAGAGGAARAWSSATAAGLVERDAELRALDGALARLREGRGGVLVFEGPAGIGKTALLAELRARVEADGAARVVHARASLLEREYGFGVVRQLLGAVAPEDDVPAAARSALGPAGGTGESTFAVLDGLFAVAARLAAERPLVLGVDDLQWADPASLRFLAYLARRIAERPVLVAASLRTGEPGADELLLAEIAADPAVTVRPGPLSAAATAALVRERLGARADAPLADACQDVTAGNPLLVRQLLAALESERGATAANVREIGSRAVSRSVLQRLARLSDDALAVARAIATLGDPPGLRAVAELAGISEDAALAAAEQLEKTDILSADPPLSFVHALVREAVYLDLSAVRRGAEHARAAELLYRSGASPERIAAQLLQAPPKGDPWVAARLREAADLALRRGAPDAALTLLERAQAEPPPAEDRAALALELGGSAAYLRGPAGVEPLRRAYDGLTDPADRARAALALSHLLMFVRSPDEGVLVARRAIAELGDDPGARDARQGLLSVCLLGAAFGAHDDAGPVTEEPRGDGPGARLLRAMMSFTLAADGAPAAEASAMAREALLAGEGMAGFTLTAPLAVSIVALTLGDPGEGLAAIGAYARQASAAGEILGAIGANLWGGYAHILAGDLDEAQALLERAQEGERLWGTKLDAVMGYSAAFMSYTSLLRGDRERAAVELHRVEASSGTSDGARAWLAAKAELLIAQGAWAEAIAITERLEPMRPADAHPVWAPWRGLRARALAGLGDGAGRAAEARALAEAELAVARAVGADWVVARGLRILAEVTRGDDGDGEAERLLADAAALLEDSTAGLERLLVARARG